MNWEAFNPRKDLKSTSWFRLSNCLFEDPTFYEFSHGEMLVWIYLLTLASKRQSGSISVNFSHAERVARLKTPLVLSAIDKLEQIHCVRKRDVDVTRTSHHERTNERTNTLSAQGVSRDFDLLKIYEVYPRKQGKQEGLKRLRTQVRSQDDFDGVVRALEKFVAYHRRIGTDPKFIPYFSTWVSSWRDWLDPDAGKIAITAQPEYRLKKVDDL